MCWSASSSVSSRSPCSPSQSFVCRTQQGLIRARGIPIGGLLGSRHTLSTPTAQRCAPPDYFGAVTNPVSDRTKIVPSRASQPGSHTRGVQPSAARARPAGPYSHTSYYSKSPVWDRGDGYMYGLTSESSRRQTTRAARLRNWPIREPAFSDGVRQMRQHRFGRENQQCRTVGWHLTGGLLFNTIGIPNTDVR